LVTLHAISQDSRPPTVVRRGEPVTVGVPLPRGLCSQQTDVALRDSAGQRIPVQTRPLDRWSDGSIRWLLVDYQTNGAPHYEVDIGGCNTAGPGGPEIEVRGFPNDLTISTGIARFRVKATGRFPFEAVEVNGRSAIDVQTTDLQIVDGAGAIWPIHMTAVTLEEPGALRAVVAAAGFAGPADDPLLLATARLHFFATSPTVRFALTLQNPRRAAHRGGYWELGDHGSVYVRDVALRISLPHADETPRLRCWPERTAQELSGQEGSFALYQESSGGEHWASPVHVNRRGVVPHRHRGYRLRAGTREWTGLRAAPVIALETSDRQLAISVPQFWQNFPKTLDASSGSLSLRLWPGEYPDLHEIQGGEQKTHTFYVAFGRDEVTPEPLAWTHEPVLICPHPSWYCSTGTVPYLIPAADDPNADYLRLVNAAIEGSDTFLQKRETVDEYGWRHFGDIPADHEAVFHRGTRPLVSHYNNQYDAIAGFAYSFMRSGDPRWWHYMVELANHVIDIDLYHTDRDKSAYNHGLFWHTAHHTHAGTATHRSYPRTAGVHGGGPSNEHSYSTGLLLYYFLTGDPGAREAVSALGRWVVDMDDASKTSFGWVDRGCTGLASSTASTTYHGPGRGAGNSITTLLNAHRLTGAAVFLDKAEQLIRRCIHPDDEIAARGLLDAERRWSYVVFLQALGRYLDDKIERAELDRMYAYARASLLSYARWMAGHEYPYLQKPEILEFPTETWAAQDMRKSEVFKFASKHSTGHERVRFLERADFFFTHSTAELTATETRTRARPVVLMLSYGFMQAAFQRDAPSLSAPAPAGSFDFGRPEQFVPQRTRVRQRLAAIAGLVGLLVLGRLAWLWV